MKNVGYYTGTIVTVAILYMCTCRIRASLDGYGCVVFIIRFITFVAIFTSVRMYTYYFFYFVCLCVCFVSVKL